MAGAFIIIALVILFAFALNRIGSPYDPTRPHHIWLHRTKTHHS